MYFRLAFKNVKRSIKDYLIYIMTLTACISLFYAFLSITSCYYKPDIGAVCQSVYDKESTKGICSAEHYGDGAINDCQSFLYRNIGNGTFLIGAGDCIGSRFLAIYYCYVAADFSETLCIFVYVVSGYCIPDRFLFLRLFCNRRIVSDSNYQKD